MNECFKNPLQSAQLAFFNENNTRRVEPRLERKKRRALYMCAISFCNRTSRSITVDSRQQCTCNAADGPGLQKRRECENNKQQTGRLRNASE